MLETLFMACEDGAGKVGDWYMVSVVVLRGRGKKLFMIILEYTWRMQIG